MLRFWHSFVCIPCSVHLISLAIRHQCSIVLETTENNMERSVNHNREWHYVFITQYFHSRNNIIII